MRRPVRLLVNKHPRIGIWKGLKLQEVQLQQNMSTLSYDRFVNLTKHTNTNKDTSTNIQYDENGKKSVSVSSMLLAKPN